jgi:hypothetical protein
LCSGLQGRPGKAVLPFHACRTYAVGLLIPKAKYKKAQYWDTSEPYHYIRTDEWDDQNYLLIVGGWPPGSWVSAACPSTPGIGMLPS